MISITRLYCGVAGQNEDLRYPARNRPSFAPAAQEKSTHVHLTRVRPVVVWNMTNRCNLRCAHCYASAVPAAEAGAELSTAEGKAMLAALAEYGCPVVLFSGGEPLLREDLPELIAHATDLGLRAALSTNGMLFTPKLANRLKQAGLTYVGISVDGEAEIHDRLRGMNGAFEQTLRGLRVAREASLQVGLRHTLTQQNSGQIPYIFHLLDREGAFRLCFYHLVPAGRGSVLTPLTANETRTALQQILQNTAHLAQTDTRKEILTVGNHADGVWILLRLGQENPARSAEVHRLLSAGGGNRSGLAIACVGPDGTVYPDQFSRTHPLGNLRQQSFRSIWDDDAGGLLTELRTRAGRVGGRCAACGHFALCNGNLRARAEGMTGDFWAADPGCYLTAEELAVTDCAAGGVG